jgi:cadmium resistance protein CadD (predicted permease)
MALEALTAFGLIASTFAATNIDNLALLVAWLIEGRKNRRIVLQGYGLGMLALLVVCVGFGLGAARIPIEWIGYLGILPITLGVRGLFVLVRDRNVSSAPDDPSTMKTTRPLSIAGTQLANGTDTALVFGPLLADSELGLDLTMIAGFVFMAAAWFGLARFLETHASQIRVLERYGHWIAPIVLIVVGFYILDNTQTDIVPGQ